MNDRCFKNSMRTIEELEIFLLQHFVHLDSCLCFSFSYNDFLALFAPTF